MNLLLRSLSWSAVPREEFEVLVCDDGSLDDIQDVVQRWRLTGMDARLVQVRARGAQPRNNVAARNAGMRAARFPVLLNTDSDMVFMSDVLDEMRRALLPGAFASSDTCFPLSDAATAEIRTSAGSAAPSASVVTRYVTGRLNQVDAPDGVGALHAAFACWRSTLVELGGYDESYELWGWEDLDLLTRLQRGMGLRRLRVPSTVVLHQWHPPQRGEDYRTEAAADGFVSLRALTRQLQRAMSPMLIGCVRNRPGQRRTIPTWNGQVLDREAYAELDLDGLGPLCASSTAGSALQEGPSPLEDALVAAHRLEAAALRQAGYPLLARKLLLWTMLEPWRRAASPPRWLDWTPPPVRGVLAESFTRYGDSANLLLELADCSAAVGDEAAAADAVRILEGWSGGAAPADGWRARRLLANRAWTLAARIGLLAFDSSPRTDYLAIVAESLARQHRYADLLATIDVGLSNVGDVDLFERLLLGAYVASASRRGETVPGGTRLAALQERLVAEQSEFLFSVGVRAARAGLHVAAQVLFDRFACSPAALDPGLSNRASSLLNETCRCLAVSVENGGGAGRMSR